MLIYVDWLLTGLHCIADAGLSQPGFHARDAARSGLFFLHLGVLRLFTLYFGLEALVLNLTLLI
jgi:hypothetical protein